MPPKIMITRQQVLDAAFELVRREGLAALSARRVARQLGCSTQPVYRAYRSMEQLRVEVLRRAEAVARSYLAGDRTDERPFLQIGLGSLRFAQQEPQLFRLAPPHVRDLQQGKMPPDFLLDRMRTDPVLAPMSDEQLARINTLMWFFSQGLATLFASSEMDGDPMRLAVEYLMLAGRAVVELETRRNES